MRRADRLFQIIQLLKQRRITTAAYLADRLEVFQRTFYRDINDLVCSGVPIQGEAGVGYALHKGFDMPPLMFTEEEIEAITLGARMVVGFSDPALSRAARDAVDKIEAVIPQRLKPRIAESRLFSPNFSPSPRVARYTPVIRQAINQQRKIRLVYIRRDGRPSDRTLRPLCLAFIAPNWLLAAWCELRWDFRNFRLDRITELTVLEDGFQEETGKSLDDFLRKVGAESKNGE